MLTPFEPWFVVVLLITVYCTDSVDLSLWSGWLLSCFCCPFSRVCGRFADVSSDWAHIPLSQLKNASGGLTGSKLRPSLSPRAQRCRLENSEHPLSFPRAFRVENWELRTESWELRVENWELRTERYDYLMSWEQRRLYPAAVTLKLEKKSVKIRGICVTLWIEDYKIGVNLCNLWANVKKNENFSAPRK